MTHVARRLVAGILLAGGKSQRMGRDKALLDFEGAPMIAWCAAALAECAPMLIVSSSSGSHAAAAARAVADGWPRFTVLRGVDVETVVDAPGSKGPLAGLAAALEHARAEHLVVSACDTPLVPAAFYRSAVDLLKEFEAVAPQLEAPEPLISAWRREPALAAARELLPAGRGPRALLERLDARFVPRTEIQGWGLDPRKFASANTPTALGALLALARA